MLEDAPLVRGGVGQHGVAGDDQRGGEAVDEIAHHLAVGTAEDAVFVLQPDGIGAAGVDRLGRAISGGVGRSIVRDALVVDPSPASSSAQTSTAISGRKRASCSVRSAVKVAIPHLRGT